ncbi:hypothetical protein KAR91_09240 [Candidatus Pacearchaeota archaeon]|nr:hypothetical protein [Candidatus Pacearchaeota archaeon]
MTDETLAKGNLLSTQITDIEDQQENFTGLKTAVHDSCCTLSISCEDYSINFDDQETNNIIHAAVMKTVNQRLKTLKARFAKL